MSHYRSSEINFISFTILHYDKSLCRIPETEKFTTSLPTVCLPYRLKIFEINNYIDIHTINDFMNLQIGLLKNI